ncbi:MAG: O-succinylhomoserine sulfhydrylase [Gammaproteobacteria bacterium]
MSENPYESLGLSTIGARAGVHRSAEQENSDPLFLTSSFCFESAAQAAAVFAGEIDGNVYSRFTNPTVRVFEERLAALERGEACLATSSGMSAILTVLLGLLQSGDHIVSARGIFGTTTGLLQSLAKFGISTTFVEATDLDAWQRALTAHTRLLFLETPSNPLTEVADIAALAALAHAEPDRLLVVDNCFCTPALQQPLALGADIVVHSATKYLDGQGRCVGGAIVTTAARIRDRFFPFLRAAGPSMSPFNAWVFLKGLETLTLRMQAHSQSAGRIAAWLEVHPAVAKVFYPGLPGHPQHALAARQQRGFGGIVSFEVHGGRAEAWRVIDHLKLFSITGNLGDTRSIVTHPASTTHGRLAPDARREMGIGDALIRLSIGLEDMADLESDLAQALGP